MVMTTMRVRYYYSEALAACQPYSAPGYHQNRSTSIQIFNFMNALVFLQGWGNSLEI